MRNSGLYVGGGGLSGVFCVLFKGKCCAFFCGAFFRRLQLCFSKVRPEDFLAFSPCDFFFRTLLGKNKERKDRVFRVRTCMGSVLSGVVVDFNMEYAIGTSYDFLL